MAQIVTLGDHFIAPEALQAVGRVTVTFGQLEHVLRLLVKRFLNRGFDEGMAYAERLKTIKALRDKCSELHAQRTMDQQREAALDALLASAEDLYRRRNAVVHGVWALDAHGRITRVYEGRDHGADADELNVLANRVREVTIRLNQYG